MNSRMNGLQKTCFVVLFVIFSVAMIRAIHFASIGEGTEALIAFSTSMLGFWSILGAIGTYKRLGKFLSNIYKRKVPHARS